MRDVTAVLNPALEASGCDHAKVVHRPRLPLDMLWCAGARSRMALPAN